MAHAYQRFSTFACDFRFRSWWCPSVNSLKFQPCGLLSHSFRTRTPIPNPQSQYISQSYGSVLPTSLTVSKTNLCSPGDPLEPPGSKTNLSKTNLCSPGDTLYPPGSLHYIPQGASAPLGIHYIPQGAYIISPGSKTNLSKTNLYSPGGSNLQKGFCEKCTEILIQNWFCDRTYTEILIQKWCCDRW